MATKIICDECGAEGAGRCVVDLSRSASLKLPAGHPWRFDRDLCQKHFNDILVTLDGLFAKAKV